MRAGFAQFAAFSKDAEDNKIFQRTKLTMPVLAVGGEKSFGAVMAVNMRNVASDVREAIVPNAGHWLMEENAPFTVALVRDFLGSQQAGAGERRTSPKEFEFSGGLDGGTGTSAVTGIRTVVLKGESRSARPLHHHVARAAEHSNCGTRSPRRPRCHRRVRNVVLRLRRSIRRRRFEGAAAGQLLHRAAQPRHTSPRLATNLSSCRSQVLDHRPPSTSIRAQIHDGLRANHRVLEAHRCDRKDAL